MEKLLVTRKEAADALAISVKTLDVLRNKNMTRALTIGARVYFSPDELRSFTKKEDYRTC